MLRPMIQVDVQGYDARGWKLPRIPPFYAVILVEDEAVEDEQHEQERADNQCGDKEEVIRSSEIAHEVPLTLLRATRASEEGFPAVDQVNKTS